MTIVYGNMVSPEGWVETDSHRYTSDCPACGAEGKLHVHDYENRNLEPCTYEQCSECDYTFNDDQFVDP